MDYTFGFAALFGLVLTIVTYRTPKAVFLRDGLGKGDTGNRMLLIAVPGLTVLSLGVQLFEILDSLTRGLSPWRVWGLPFAVLLIVIGLGVTLWAFIPGPAPFCIAGTNSLGIDPPLIALINSNPFPFSFGSSFNQQ